MTQDVDPAVIKAAGDTYRRVFDASSAAVTRLAGVLKNSAGMAGTDAGAHVWAVKYDALCGGRSGTIGAMEAISASVMAAGQCADLLHATAVNHSNADVRSAANGPNAPVMRIFNSIDACLIAVLDQFSSSPVFADRLVPNPPPFFVLDVTSMVDGIHRILDVVGAPGNEGHAYELPREKAK